MSCTLSKLLFFTTGAAIGSLVTWKILKNKYQRIADEEIEYVREFYANRNVEPEQTSDNTASDTQQTKPSKYQYADIINEQQYGEADGSEIKEGHKMVGEPYVISPAELGENDYEIISLTYYADGVLADDMDEEIEDVDDVVGVESLEHFGEYDEDSVCVRNDRLECDYEILLDSRKYENVKKLYRPHQVEE